MHGDLICGVCISNLDVHRAMLRLARPRLHFRLFPLPLHALRAYDGPIPRSSPRPPVVPVLHLPPPLSSRRVGAGAAAMTRQTARRSAPAPDRQSPSALQEPGRHSTRPCVPTSLAGGDARLQQRGAEIFLGPIQACLEDRLPLLLLQSFPLLPALHTSGGPDWQGSVRSWGDSRASPG